MIWRAAGLDANVKRILKNVAELEGGLAGYPKHRATVIDATDKDAAYSP